MAKKKNEKENLPNESVEKEMANKSDDISNNTDNHCKINNCDCKCENGEVDSNSDESNAKLDGLNKELENVNNKLVRLQADFLNYKNRSEKEKFATYSNAIADVLKDLLPIIDNLERGIEVAEKSESEEVKNYNKGVKMVYDQFMNALAKRGLTEIEALNAKFDPNLHSGIAFEATNEKEEDTIIEVFQKGYTVNEKVIRPSMVKIAKNK